MIIRALSSDHDFQFGLGLQNYLRNQDAIAENIQTRLLCILNDCFFDKNFGIDWIRLLGTKSTEQEIKLQCRAMILQSYGVVRVNSISVSVTNRRILLQYNIDTIFTSQFSQNLEVPSA